MASVNIYTTVGPNSWTKPAGLIGLRSFLVGGGGGGGSGRRAVAGGLRSGGGGGGGGGFTSGYVPFLFVENTVIVNVGRGGVGGLGITVDGDGATGEGGTNSAFGGWVSAGRGARGSAGTAANTVG